MTILFSCFPSPILEKLLFNNFVIDSTLLKIFSFLFFFLLVKNFYHAIAIFSFFSLPILKLTNNINKKLNFITNINSNKK